MATDRVDGQGARHGTYMGAGPEHGPVLPGSITGIAEPSAQVWITDNQREDRGSESGGAGQSGQREDVESHFRIMENEDSVKSQSREAHGGVERRRDQKQAPRRRGLE